MAAPTKCNVVLYRATNTINGKVYIGVTSRALHRRRAEHESIALSGRGSHPFALAIRKYGVDAFRWEVLQTFFFSDDALQAEIAEIRTISPRQRYNFTDGGPGQIGRPMSEDGRKRISEAHRGNKYRLGMTHSVETRSILRKHGLAAKGRFEQFQKLGPAAVAKRVVCLDTGEIYPSASAAATANSLSKSLVIEVCRRNPRRRTAGGKVFRYEGDHHGGQQEAEAVRALKKSNLSGSKLEKSVLCLTDGCVYPSAKEAGAAYGAHRSSIGEVCRGIKQSVRGRRFSYMIESA